MKLIQLGIFTISMLIGSVAGAKNRKPAANMEDMSPDSQIELQSIIGRRFNGPSLFGFLANAKIPELKDPRCHASVFTDPYHQTELALGYFVNSVGVQQGRNEKEVVFNWM